MEVFGAICVIGHWMQNIMIKVVGIVWSSSSGSRASVKLRRTGIRLFHSALSSLVAPGSWPDIILQLVFASLAWDPVGTGRIDCGSLPRRSSMDILRDKEASLFPSLGSEHSYVHGWMLLMGFNDPQLVKVPALSNSDELLLSPEYLLAGASSYPTTSQRSIIFNFDDKCKTTFTLLYLHYDPWFSRDDTVVDGLPTKIDFLT
ncbi:hypothetical protein FB451DRAFT_1184815 [Mycena latifolia]|nr:hypothetical protein FB451DRAFT_1184815 [Mycena latifolia]